MREYQITGWCHRFIKERVKPGDICIDATAGKGNDTSLLAQLVGSTGKVYAFDIQEAAVLATRKRLADEGGEQQTEVILDSHLHMDNYVEPETVNAIMFNFGYLPGGDHTISTKPETSVQAIEKGLKLLKKNGVMSLCIYSGGDTGFAEKEAILKFLEHLNEREYMVIVSLYYNRPNNPPIPAFIVKL